ncbi:MAG: MarR family transcriptional regulator [Solobacterium sp.]|nr:MarR family transcriptional regulator [Solobacterium sp.]
MKEQLRLEHQLCFPLYACARKVTGYYTPYFKPLGITYTQYIVFLALWEEDNVSVSDLSRRLYLDSGTLTPLLKKMEQEGYLIRRRSSEDERVVLISLTEQGKELEAKAEQIPAMVGSCIPLSAEEAKTLYSLLYKILLQEEQ